MAELADDGFEGARLGHGGSVEPDVVDPRQGVDPLGRVMRIESGAGVRQDQPHLGPGLAIAPDGGLVDGVRQGPALDHVEHDDQFLLVGHPHVLFGQEFLDLGFPGLLARSEMLVHLQAHHGEAPDLLAHLLRVHVGRDDKQRP